MSHGIVIIGSGFAARQLVKNIRKQDANVPLTLIAADSMDEYNKPDLSHVISQSQRADDLTRQSAGSLPNSLICACSHIPGNRHQRRCPRSEKSGQAVAVRQAGAGDGRFSLCTTGYRT